MSSQIRSVLAWEALDSRANPTIACRVELGDGASGSALVPSGASTGAFEAVERRDGGARYAGRGVRGAVASIRDTLEPAVVGVEASAVDARLRAADPSPGFATLGANAVLAVSIATARAAAASAGVSLARFLAGTDVPLLLPTPMVNVISGGAHAGAAIDFQDFLVVPMGVTTFAAALERCAAVRHAAQQLARERGHHEAVLVADEGGLGLRLGSNRAALDLLVDAIERCGLVPGVDAAIAIDVAATQLVDGAGYRLAGEQRRLDADALIDELAGWCDEYPIRSIEDPLGDHDWSGWAAATKLRDRVQLVGDDLFATDPSRLERGIREGVANAVLIKVNQNGLVSGAAGVLERARRAGYATVVSARSGETEDAWLADLAVGWRAGQIKVGSTHRSERTAKWNRLLELEATEHTVYHDRWSTRSVEGTDT